MNGTLERDIYVPLSQWVGHAGGSRDAHQAVEQTTFVTAHIADLLIGWNTHQDNVLVMSEHRSLSVIYPVYRINIPDVGWVQFRGNGYNWIVSCDLIVEIEADFGDMVDSSTSVSSAHAEGFKQRDVFGSYTANQSQFTVEIRSANHHDLYAFMYILRTALQAQGADFPKM